MILAYLTSYIPPSLPPEKEGNQKNIPGAKAPKCDLLYSKKIMQKITSLS